MRHRVGEDRQQGSLFPQSLEEFVAAEHPARVIDAFVDQLDLQALGFDKALPKATGRKPYHPGDLLKLYVYGYLNRVSTSRRLERECQRNVELMWLLRRLQPDFKTIADFRKDNAAAVRGSCRAFVEFCREVGVLRVTRVAIDGSKFKAAGSLDAAFTRAQLERDQAQIEQHIAQYLQQLDEADRAEPAAVLESQRVAAALQRLYERQQGLQRVEHAMQRSGREEHCASEPEARLMRSGREGTVLGYNVQSAVDADTGLIVHHEVTDEPGDTRLLAPVATHTQEALAADRLEVLADGGYANGEHLAQCEHRGITATVPRRIIPGSRAGLYQKADFRYEPERDRYRCPAGEVLSRSRDNLGRKLHVYQRRGCARCALQSRCTPSDTRSVTRHFFEDAYARSEARLRAAPDLMRERLAIVERPFAVIKQAMGLRRLSCRGLRPAGTEMALAVLAYNLQHLTRRLGAPALLALLR